MDDSKPPFFARLGIAFASLWRALVDPDFALEAKRLRTGGPRPVLRAVDEDSALQLLALFQREGRLVDFLQEDLAGFADADIGAAARVVHQGCRKALADHMTLSPVRTEDEGATVVVPAGFDAGALRLVGNVSGQPPFRGTLRHRGWRATEVRLPRLAEGVDARVLAPAEVEL